MRQALVTLAAATALASAPAPPEADEPAAVVPYRVFVDGRIKITSDRNIVTTRRTQAEFDYRVARTRAGVNVAIDRFALKVLADGQEVDSVEMSRSRLVSRRADRPIDVRRENAPPALQPMFAQFDPPLAEIGLDPEGAETARKTKVDGGPLLEAHVVDVTRLFHPRFPKDQPKWDAPVVLPFGKGQVANGMLRYAKRKVDDPEKAKDGLVAVDVTGHLIVTGKHDEAEIKRGAYKVAGLQWYDPKSGEWVSGKLTVAAGFEAVLPNGMTYKGDGPVTLTMSRREPTGKGKASKKKS